MSSAPATACGGTTATGRRRWTSKAVVGSWPEPFLSGEGGKKIPVRLDCANDAEAACDEVAERLEDEGVKVGGRSAIASPGGEGLLRVKVGTWTEVRKDPAVRELEKGPGASGVFALPVCGRDLDRAARPRRARRPARSAPATGSSRRRGSRGEAPTWIVTGTDEAGVDAAAAQLADDALDQHFAIGVRAGRPEPLPVQPEPETP